MISSSFPFKDDTKIAGLLVVADPWRLYGKRAMNQRLPICSECGQTYEHTQQESPMFPDGGICVAPKTFGHYGGFTDNMPWDPISDDDYISLCHDCCVLLVRAFPSIVKAMGGYAHHPCSDEIPCCEFAWTFKRHPETNELQTYLGTAEGMWVLDPREESGPGGD